MNIRHWIADNIGYRFLGCCYNNRFNRNRKLLFSFIKSKTKSKFLNREVHDLGCGDGSNTLKIKEIFQPKTITGYERNKFLLKRAKCKGLETKKINLNRKIPKGEMATSTFVIHHLDNKEKTLKQMAENFKYLFLCEPVKDLYHALFDAGRTLTKKEWLVLFDKILKNYHLFQYKSNLIVFWSK